MIGFLIFLAVWAGASGIAWYIWSQVKLERRGPKTVPYVGLPGFPLSHYNILWHIQKALPSLYRTDYRWEIYTEQSGSRIYVVINMLSLSTSQTVKNVSKIDVSTRHHGMSWRGLAGCTNGFMYEQVQDHILTPVIEDANKAIKQVGIQASEKTNYFIV